MPIEIHSATREESHREYHAGAQCIRRSFRMASAEVAALGAIVIVKGLSVALSDQLGRGCWTIYMGGCLLLFSAGNWLRFTKFFRPRSFAAGVYLHRVGLGGIGFGIIFWLLVRYSLG